jgi:hypothetical protein
MKENNGWVPSPLAGAGAGSIMIISVIDIISGRTNIVLLDVS